MIRAGPSWFGPCLGAKEEQRDGYAVRWGRQGAHVWLAPAPLQDPVILPKRELATLHGGSLRILHPVTLTFQAAIRIQATPKGLIFRAVTNARQRRVGFGRSSKASMLIILACAHKMVSNAKRLWIRESISNSIQLRFPRSLSRVCGVLPPQGVILAPRARRVGGRVLKFNIQFIDLPPTPALLLSRTPSPSRPILCCSFQLSSQHRIAVLRNAR